MTSTTVIHEEAAPQSLSIHDRCDQCAAQAYVRVTLGESKLYFCAHHAKQHEAQLKPIASDWHDETNKLHQALQPSIED